MRAPRATRLVVSLLVAMGAAGAVGGCAGSAPVEPTLPSIDFRPKVVLEVADDGVHVRRGPREDPAVVLDPPSVGSGTVAEVRNATSTEQRLQGNGGKVFDTGTMRAGETTTVVLTNTTAGPVAVTMSDPHNPNVRGTIEVRPPAGA